MGQLFVRIMPDLSDMRIEYAAFGTILGHNCIPKWGFGVALCR